MKIREQFNSVPLIFFVLNFFQIWVKFLVNLEKSITSNFYIPMKIKIRKDVLFMYQNNYNGYYQQLRSPTQMLKGRPVASLDEVRAIPVDFDGSVFYFPDLANGKIYTKQINQDGTSSLFMYERKEIPDITYQSYVTKEELNQILIELKNSLKEEKKDIKF